MSERPDGGVCLHVALGRRLRPERGVAVASSLAVEANGQIDYFGRTVTVAARIESLADMDPLLCSAARGSEAQTFIDEWALMRDAVRRNRRPVQGIEGEMEIVLVAVAP